MTTIAYKDGQICGDGLAWENDVTCGVMQKVGPFADGSLWGFAGRIHYLNRIKEWVAWPLWVGDPPDLIDSTFVVVLPNGRVRQWEANGWCDVDAPFHAWGTGRQLALGAMAAGASAVQAVEIAADMDAYTGGPILAFTLGLVPEPEVVQEEAVDEELFVDPMQPKEPVDQRKEMRQTLGLE